MRRRQAYAVPNGLGSHGYQTASNRSPLLIVGSNGKVMEVSPQPENGACPKCGKTGNRGMHRHIQFCKGSH
jgi:hypothetical protein